MTSSTKDGGKPGKGISCQQESRNDSSDAAYLDLAMRRGLPIASLDDRLKAAAAAVGVPLFSV